MANFHMNLQGAISQNDQTKLVATMQPFDLFATRIWQVSLDALADRRPAWIAEVFALRAASPDPAGRTVRQGWNSTGEAVLERQAFVELGAAVRLCCAEALK